MRTTGSPGDPSATHWEPHMAKERRVINNQATFRNYLRLRAGQGSESLTNLLETSSALSLSAKHWAACLTGAAPAASQRA